MKSIAINGRKLHEVQMPLAPDPGGGVSRLSYPKQRVRFQREGDSAVLGVPPLLALELYRSGTLPQDGEASFPLDVGGRRAGTFRVAEVHYPHTSAPREVVIFFLQRVPRSTG
jgi:hypothetical protein